MADCSFPWQLFGIAVLAVALTVILLWLAVVELEKTRDRLYEELTWPPTRPRGRGKGG